MKRSRLWFNRAALLVASVGLIWLLSEIGWAKIGQHLSMVGWTGVLALLTVGMAEAVLDSLALQKATHDRVSLWRVLFLNQAGATLNTVAPGGTGELLKVSLLTKEIPGGATAATLVWNVAFRLSKSTVLVLAAAVAYFSLPSFRGPAALILGLGFLGFGIYIALLITIRTRGISRVLAQIARFPCLAGGRIERFAVKVREVELQTSAFRRDDPGRYRSIVLFQFAARTADLLAACLALRFLGSEYPFALCALIYAGAQLISYILPLLPTRIGTTEGSMYLLFSFLGLDGGLGVIFQVLLRIMKLTVNGFCLLGTLRQHRRIRSAPPSTISTEMIQT